MRKGNQFLRNFLVIIIAAVALTACQNWNLRRNTETTSDYSIYVDDRVGIVSDTTEKLVYDANAELENDYSGAQIVVAVVKTTGGESIRNYAKSLFNEKGIGSSAYNNGLLLLIATEDDDYWVTNGSGFSDLFAGELAVILNDYMEPEFAKGNYDESIQTVIPALVNAVKEAGSSWYTGSSD